MTTPQEKENENATTFLKILLKTVLVSPKDILILCVKD